MLSSVFFPQGSVNAFTIGEEREVGEKLLFTVRNNLDVLDDPDLTQYITKLGQEVLSVAGLQFFDYNFFIIENKEYNAFAAPSGLVFFYSGLIEKMTAENELVAVLAHEIGHVVKRHIAERVDKGNKVTIATMGLILASLALGGGTATEALFSGALAAGKSASLHFSRLNEEEADRLAFSWMKQMDRDPKGQVKMLQTMRQIARYRSGMVPQYLLTHPNPEARLDYVQTLIDTDQDKRAYLTGEDNREFLRFKYRILSQIRDGMYLRGYFASILSHENSDDDSVIMAKYGLAQLERKENNYPKSLELINEVIEAYAEINNFRVDKGIIEFESGQVEQAYTTLHEAYLHNRDDMYCAYYLGRVALSRGFVEEAERLFKTVMFRLPYFSRIYFELGRLSAANEKQAEASYYLGKKHLVEGKLMLAKMHLKKSSELETLPPELELDVNRSLDLIQRLEKD